MSPTTSMSHPSSSSFPCCKSSGKHESVLAADVGGNVAESMFSPRSTAAMALSSLNAASTTAPPPSQQALFPIQEEEDITTAPVHPNSSEKRSAKSSSPPALPKGTTIPTMTRQQTSPTVVDVAVSAGDALMHGTLQQEVKYASNPGERYERSKENSTSPNFIQHQRQHHHPPIRRSYSLPLSQASQLAQQQLLQQQQPPNVRRHSAVLLAAPTFSSSDSILGQHHHEQLLSTAPTFPLGYNHRQGVAAVASAGHNGNLYGGGHAAAPAIPADFLPPSPWTPPTWNQHPPHPPQYTSDGYASQYHPSYHPQQHQQQQQQQLHHHNPYDHQHRQYYPQSVGSSSSTVDEGLYNVNMNATHGGHSQQQIRYPSSASKQPPSSRSRPVVLHPSGMPPHTASGGDATGSSTTTPVVSHRLMHPVGMYSTSTTINNSSNNGSSIDHMRRSASWDPHHDPTSRFESAQAPLQPMHPYQYQHQQMQQQQVHFYPPVSATQNGSLVGTTRPLLAPHHTSVTPTPHKRLKIHHAIGSASSSSSSSSSMQQHHHAMAIAATPAPTVSYSKQNPSPTGSPAKYNRKHKSLGILADSFLKQLTTPTATSSPLNDFCQEIVIDKIATDLAVERRRVYDVVNILEALQVVVKMGKNTYHWMGREHLSRQFALLQNEAVEQWPELAVKSGLLMEMPDNAVTKDDRGEPASKEANKSLTRLSQLFLQVFLVGVEHVSLPEASDLIHGGKSSAEELVALGMQEGDEYPTDPRKLQKVAARGLKTKIRRLYDIANVFLSVGLLRKVENRYAPTSEGKRPQFQWNYGLDVMKIRQVYFEMPDHMKQNSSPFNEIQEAILVKSSVNNPNYSGILTFSGSLSTATSVLKDSSPNSRCSSVDNSSRSDAPSASSPSSVDAPTASADATATSTPPIAPMVSLHSANSAMSACSEESRSSEQLDDENETSRNRILRELMEGGSMALSTSSPERRVSLANEASGSDRSV